MATRIHPLKTSRRTGTVTITELPTKVVVAIELSAYGEFGDEEEFARALWPLLFPYENDPRPVEMTHPLYPQTATINKVGEIPYAVITEPTRQ